MNEIISVFHSLSKNLLDIHKTSCEGISVIQSSILYEINLLKNPSMQTVADAIRMDITTFSRQISSLEKKALIARNPYEGDRRIYILSLTEKGKKTMEVTNEVIVFKMENTLATMNDFERETVIRSLHVLEEKLRTYRQ